MSNAEVAGSALRLVEEREFAEALGCPVERVAKLVAAGALFVVERDGARLYPSFFTDPTLDLRQLGTVVKLLEGWDNFTKWRFFISGKGSLGGSTPLEALRQGQFAQVKKTAEGFAER